MTRWFTSDLHLGHRNIVRYTGRPYPSVEVMDDDLIARLNRHVAPDDELWVIGDVAMGDITINILLVE
jgi:calcineurin-like phosphoesterase family protein